jgi:thymidylate synthase (FAD)
MNTTKESIKAATAQTETQSPVKLVCKTPDAEKMIAYIARVSNPKNQKNENFAGLLKYCIKHAHWSIFEQASMTLEIDTNRAIATQILRHRSFTFQQFSQRYADNSAIAAEIPLPDLRSQDYKNRQNSIDDLSAEEKKMWHDKINTYFQQGFALYKDMLEAGIAKECARFILPECMPARMYMTGSVRSWIHYIELRSAHGTQKEHIVIAQACKDIFIESFPVIAEALQELKPEIWK